MTTQRYDEQVHDPPELAEVSPLRGSTWWPPTAVSLIALFVLVVGIVLAGVGIVVGSSDEPARLRGDIREAETAVATAQADFEEATVEGATLGDSVEEYVAGTEPLMDAIEEGCSCSERLTRLNRKVLPSLQAFLRNPMPAEGRRLDRLADQMNVEADRLEWVLDEIRPLHAGLPAL